MKGGEAAQPQRGLDTVLAQVQLRGLRYEYGEARAAGNAFGLKGIAVKMKALQACPVGRQFPCPRSEGGSKLLFPAPLARTTLVLVRS